MINLDEIQPDLCTAISRFHFTGWLINFFKKYFSDVSNIEHQSFKSRPYVDGENTGLFIGDSSALDYDLIEKRPAILIQRKSSQLKFLPMLGGEVDSVFALTKPERLYILHNFTFVYIIFCLGKNVGESEILSWEVSTAINKLTRALGLSGIVHYMTVDSVGGQSLVPESSRIYVTPVRLISMFNLTNKVFIT